MKAGVDWVLYFEEVWAGKHERKNFCAALRICCGCLGWGTERGEALLLWDALRKMGGGNRGGGESDKEAEESAWRDWGAKGASAAGMSGLGTERDNKGVEEDAGRGDIWATIEECLRSTRHE